ncbi:DBLOH-like protein [Mya arenaria]|uniref:Direct IAP-binding protein with low pI n=2 Tax=Mya arenaria TaxID=6604 RepID=A0ABY7FVW9_MYAAR|nr:DBLOH-like protein [Mya arenaria]
MAARTAFCQIRKKFNIFRRFTSFSISRVPRTKVCLGLISPAFFLKLSCDTKIDLEEPDPRTLSREFLIKSSSLLAAENAMGVLSQTTLALQQAEKEYQEAIEAVIFMMELKLQVLGDPTEEARLWDLILQGRDMVKRKRRKRDDLYQVQRCAERFVESAAELTYMTGSEIVASSASERLNKANIILREVKIKTEKAEERLVEAEVKTIEVEGKFAEENKERLDEEMSRLIAEGAVVVETDGEKGIEGSEEGSDIDTDKDTANVKQGPDPESVKRMERVTVDRLSETLNRRSQGKEKFEYVELFDKWDEGDNTDNIASDI